VAIDYARLENRQFADIEQAYGWKDTIRYALGQGPGVAAFRVSVPAREVVVLNNGRAEYLA
jgi:hypothetical protein